MAKFCKYCGRRMEEGEVCHCREEAVEGKGAPASNESAGENTAGETRKASELKTPEELKVPKAIGIVNTVAGALLFFIGIADIDYDWGLIAFLAAIGFLVTGILEIAKKSFKGIGVVQIVMGALSVIIGLCCDMDYDWGYIGLFIGIAFLVTGLLRLLNKSIKAIAILEIVFGGILLFFGFADIDFDWGMTALAASAGFMVSGILFLVYNRAKS